MDIKMQTMRNDIKLFINKIYEIYFLWFNGYMHQNILKTNI